MYWIVKFREDRTSYTPTFYTLHAILVNVALFCCFTDLAGNMKAQFVM